MAQSFQYQIKVAARRFCKRRNITLGTLGQKVLNNSKFFLRLEANGDCGIVAYQKMMAYIKKETARLDAEKEAKRNG